MFNFFKNKIKKEKNKNNDLLKKTACLLIHAAKIDDNYTKREKKIIRKSLIKLGVKSDEVDKIMITAEKEEENSTHILNFTKEIKNTNKDFKILIVRTLWEIIYSNKEADMYETNLMRRLSGLLYIDNKDVGDLKEAIKREFE